MRGPVVRVLSTVGVLAAVGLGIGCTPAQPTGGKPSSTASPQASRQDLPDCEALAKAVPESALRNVKAEDGRSQDTVDDGSRSRRLCTFRGEAADGGPGGFTVVANRIFTDSYTGVPRQRYLRETANGEVSNACDGGWYTVSGFQWATACYLPASNGGQVAIGVVSGDTMVVVRGVDFRGEESPAELRERITRDALAVTKALLSTVQR